MTRVGGARALLVRAHRGRFQEPSQGSCVAGEVSEWPKEHDWKSCVPKGTEGSNPSLSSVEAGGSRVLRTLGAPRAPGSLRVAEPRCARLALTVRGRRRYGLVLRTED